MVKFYNIFISHSWSYDGTYESVEGFFDDYSYFFWKDNSIPKNNPIHYAKTDTDLENALYNKIARAGCVVVGWNSDSIVNAVRDYSV